ncbi:uncharacterized protein LOC116948521 [Petromyzon marinus]|nr:actin-like [Petromyzon marinus]
MDNPAVVMDNGSGLCKAGFAGENAPRFCVPSLVGRPRQRDTMLVSRGLDDAGGSGDGGCYIGRQALCRRGVLSLRYPVERGIVTRWDDMERVWAHAYEAELHARPQDQPVLLTEAPLNPLENREQAAQLLFERFGAPAVHIAVQAVLSLYASGMVTGLAVGVGDGVTHAVPVFEGYGLPRAVLRSDVAGRDVTDNLGRILAERGHAFVSSAEWEIVADIKEQVCYVAGDYEKELRRKPEELAVDYKLPDGQVITLHSQRFRAPELLFSPTIVGLDAPGIHQLVWKSVTRSDIDLRKSLYSNILLSGGSSLFPGLDERLWQELAKLAPRGAPVRIFAPPERKYSVWIGGSILASLSTFQQMWITAPEYKEFGPSVVHRRCL